MSDQPVTEAPTFNNTQHSQEKNIHAPMGFEPAIPTSEGLQSYALDRAAAGICKL